MNQQRRRRRRTGGIRRRRPQHAWMLPVVLMICWLGHFPHVAANSNGNENPNDGNENRNDDGGNSNSDNDWYPTLENWVDSPEATDVGDALNPIKLSFWSTPNRDWTSTLLRRLKPLVKRLHGSLVLFHPHQALIDGSLPQDQGGLLACRNPTGPTSLENMSDVCLTECVNAGRYCAVHFQEEEDDADHAGLTGADIVLESLRRMCVWQLYGLPSTLDPEEKDDTLLKYWNYIDALQRTKCDMALSDTCLDRVYREVGINADDMMDCIHDAGGAGIDVDLVNDLLQEDMKRSFHLPLDSLPQVALNGEILTNVTEWSDFQILAEVCTSLYPPKPKICDFCLLECPFNNPNDPTPRCLWDLTCGDERNFTDWIHGTGYFSDPKNYHNGTDVDTNDAENNGNAPAQEEGNQSDKQQEYPPEVHARPNGPVEISNNETDTNSTDTTTPEEEAPNKDEVPKEDETTTTSSSEAPSVTPPTNLPEDQDHDEDEPMDYSIFNNVTVLYHNDTNATNDNDESPPEPPTKPPASHHNNDNKPTNPNYANPPPENSSSGNTKPYETKPHTTSGNHTTGGTLAGGIRPSQHMAPKSPNTTDPTAALAGTALALFCLVGIVAALVVYNRYRKGDIYTTVIPRVDRDAHGLAARASHTTENDLTLNIEMSGGGASSGGGGGNEYAPPASRGTWG